jgi:rod shape-determining protein MreD
MRSTSYRPEANRQLLTRRLIVYSPAIFLLATVQCSFFSQLDFLPAVPDLMLGLVVGIAMLDTQKTGAICGIGAGFVIDALGSSGLSLSPLFYLFIGALSGAFAKKMLSSFVSWFVTLFVFSLAKSILTVLNVLYISNDILFGEMLTELLLPEFICTFVICIPIFFIVKLCMIPIDAKRRLRLDKFN